MVRSLISILTRNAIKSLKNPFSFILFYFLTVSDASGFSLPFIFMGKQFFDFIFLRVASKLAEEEEIKLEGHKNL